MILLFGAILLCGVHIKFSVSSSVPIKEYAEIKLFQSPATYSVESMVLLNDGGKDKDIGYKVDASLLVDAIWGTDNDFLLKFELHSPKLLTRGKSVTADYLPTHSVWDSYSQLEFYAHWKNGHILEIYLDPRELPDVMNYKKSLMSLFQLQIIDGENNETDISGNCAVQYDSPTVRVIRKTKRWCRPVGDEFGDGGEVADVVNSRWLTRYTLSQSLSDLDEVHAEEVHTLGFPDFGAALKARAWLRLRRQPDVATPAVKHSTLEQALAKIPDNLKAHTLPMNISDEFDDDDEMTMEEALATARGEDEEAGRGGGAAHAERLMGAVAALRAARPAGAAQRLADALHAAADHAHLTALCRLLGAAGTRAAHAAATRALQLRAREPLAHVAHHYLAALATARDPHESVVLDVLELGETSRARDLAESALLAAAAGAQRLAARGAPAHRQLHATLRDRLAGGLARCKEEECRAMWLRALGNLRHADSAELLLEQAERAGGGRGAVDVALAALDALAALPEHAHARALPRRLAGLALRARHADVRAAALDVLLWRAAPLPAPLTLAHVAHDLHASAAARSASPAAHELHRLFWQRARSLAGEHAPLADVLRLLAPELRGWDAQAQRGTSSALVRELGGAGAWRARLGSVQWARGAALRRGRVRLAASAARGRAHDVLAIELWTRGMEALTGGAEPERGGDEPEPEPEEVAGGLALTVGTARLRGLTLFNGQAELVGHVWAGTGSEPTAVLRAPVVLVQADSSLPLLAAGALRVRAGAAAHLALDAHAQVSLWSRTTRAALQLRVGLAAEVRARVAGGAAAAAGTGTGELRARAAASAEPRLHVHTDVDFYGDVQLCVRVRTDDYEHRSNVSLSSSLGAARSGVRRVRTARLPAAGRTLALGAPNDATCRALVAPAGGE